MFSTTFLSGRVNREAGRALDRALKVGDSLAERHAKAHEDTDVSSLAGSLDQQVEIIERALADPFALVLVGMNAVLAIAVVALAFVFGSHADVSLLPPTSAPAGWALLGFAGTAVLVVSVGTIDALAARREFRQQYEQTPIGSLVLARRAMERAVRSSPPEEVEVANARRFAEQAVARTGQLFAHGWATLGYVDLLALAAPRPSPTTLLHADECLRNAIRIGPSTAPMWAAWAVVAEFSRDEDAAVGRWLQAVELLVANVRIPSAPSFLAIEASNPASWLAAGPDLRSPTASEERGRLIGWTSPVSVDRG